MNATRLAESQRECFERDGFTSIRPLLANDQIERLRLAIKSLAAPAEKAGVRGLLQRSSEIAALARSPTLVRALSALAGHRPFAVRGIFFDKNPTANWRVTWHQDVTIALRTRVEAKDFGPWSVKAGVVHAHAPEHVLERMLSVRIHLDDADETNGALHVIRGSHRFGKLDETGVAAAVNDGEQIICSARAGDALVMRPLLLHSSAPATLPSHRRVIHIEYATEELPSPLEWHERVE